LKLFDIIHEDPGLLVINKPAGLVCHPTKGDEYSSLISRVRLHLGCITSLSPSAFKDVPVATTTSVVSPSPGGEGRGEGGRSLNTKSAPLPQLINRLDRETSGIVLVAKEVAVARELRRIWENRDVRKEYLAIVHGHLAAEQGTVEAPLGRDEASIIAVKDRVRPDGAASRTDFAVERRFTNSFGKFTLLKVLPYTGRKHQIRIHLAHYGHPIVGDKLYGEDEDLYLALVEDRLTEEQRRRLILPHQALHAREVQFTWRGGEHIFRAEPEGWFNDFVGADV
jgi:23S rRNA pseudouridine1911/1915/1917 synthase